MPNNPPQGTVQALLDGNVLAGVNNSLTNGQTSILIDTTSFSVGNHNLSFQYSGDGSGNEPSTSPNYPFSVTGTQQQTTTTATGIPASIVQGQQFTVTITVAA